MDDKRPEIDKSQLYYGRTVYWITIASCLVSLLAMVLILVFPGGNMLDTIAAFDAVFSGKKPAEIWNAAGVPFKYGDFWKLFIKGLFTPDGLATFGIALGCSVTLWALIPTVWQFAKKKEYFYVFVSAFIMALIFLAMSGLVNMAG
jgi:uncharacterized membrane protein